MQDISSFGVFHKNGGWGVSNCGELVVATAGVGLLNTSAISSYVGTHAQIFAGSKDALLSQAKLLLDLVQYEFPGVTRPCKDNVDYFLMESLDNFVGKI